MSSSTTIAALSQRLQSWIAAQAQPWLTGGRSIHQKQVDSLRRNPLELCLLVPTRAVARHGMGAKRRLDQVDSVPKPLSLQPGDDHRRPAGIVLERVQMSAALPERAAQHDRAHPGPALEHLAAAPPDLGHEPRQGGGAHGPGAGL